MTQVLDGSSRVAETDRRHRFETIVSAASGLGVYALALITGPLLARSLGDAGRGSLAAVIVPTQIIGWILMFGLPQASAYFAREHDRRLLQNGAWRFTVVVGAPIVAALWFVAPRFLARHPDEVVSWFRAYLVLGLLVLPFTNVIDYLRGRAENLWFNIYRSLPIILTTEVLVVFFLAQRLTLRTALGATLAANVAAWLGCIIAERALPNRAWSPPVFREQVDYGKRVWIGTLSNMVVARFDQFLMVGIVEPAELGIYVVAATAAGVSAPIAQGIAFALFPYLREEGAGGGQERTSEALRWTLFVSAAVAVAVAVAAPFLLPLAFGEAFERSILPLWILLPGQVFWNLGNVIGAKLEADNRPGAASRGLGIAAVITLLLVPIVVPFGGVVAAAIVTSYSQFSFWLVVRLAMGRHRANDKAQSEI